MNITISDFVSKYKVPFEVVDTAQYKAYDPDPRSGGRAPNEFDEIRLYNAVYTYLSWKNHKEMGERDKLIRRIKERGKIIHFLIHHDPNPPEQEVPVIKWE